MIIYDEINQTLYIPSAGDKVIFEDYEERIQEVYHSGYTAGFAQGVADAEEDCNPDYTNLPMTFEIISGGTINWTWNPRKIGSYVMGNPREIEYRINSGEWTSITSSSAGTASFEVSAGDIVEFKGLNNNYTEYHMTGESSFYGTTATFKVYGNLMSMIGGDDFLSVSSFTSTDVFYNMFGGIDGLYDAQDLIFPSFPTSAYCYTYMFAGSLNLKKAPKILPSTVMTEGCYSYMFDLCRSLETWPELPATTMANYCYNSMFSQTNLMTAPELPATNLAYRCYKGMFSFCSNLVEAPELPATTMAEGCYKGMFQLCTSLGNAPVLPAETLEADCYAGMFNGCSHLSYLKCLATDISAEYCTLDWVYEVASSGTFTKAAGMNNWTTGVNGIPDGWTVVDAE